MNYETLNEQEWLALLTEMAVRYFCNDMGLYDFCGSHVYN